MQFNPEKCRIPDEPNRPFISSEEICDYINNTKSTYTGPTIISGGTLVVKELADGGKPSSIGAASDAASNLQIGQATFNVNNPNASTTRGITLTDSAVVQVASGAVNFRGRIEGDGSLTKTGSG